MEAGKNSMTWVPKLQTTQNFKDVEKPRWPEL